MSPTQTSPSLKSLAIRCAFALSTLTVIGGCSAVSRFASDTFSTEPTTTVPQRNSVTASATPAPTVNDATRDSTMQSTTRADGMGSSTTAPMAIPGTSGSAAQSRRAVGSGMSALAGNSAGMNDNGLTEGGGNLSQVSFATEGGDYAPDVDRTGTFMVFASTQHRPTFDVYRKSVDGRTVTQLTTDPSDDLMPSIAADGTKIAFASNRNGNWDIYTMPIAGGAPTQITSDADEEVQPTWAPDGKRLAFSRKNGRTGTWEIWIVDSATPGLRTFVCEGFLPRWSPAQDKDTLLFQRARQRGSRLYGVWTIDLIRGEGLNPTEVVSAKNAAILQPNWSPDGTKIVFTTVVNPGGDSQWPDQSDIWVVNTDGTGRVGLTNSRFRNMQPAWGADGRVYFVSNRGGLENIWSITADATKFTAESVEFAANASKKAAARAGANGEAMAVAAPATKPVDTTPALLRPNSLAGVDE